MRIKPTRKKGRDRSRPSSYFRTIGKAYAPATSAVSTRMPGPIVELTATLRTYLPLAPDGLALTTASTSASKLRRRSSWLNDALPMPEWMMPAYSTRYST